MVDPYSGQQAPSASSPEEQFISARFFFSPEKQLTDFFGQGGIFAYNRLQLAVNTPQKGKNKCMN